MTPRAPRGAFHPVTDGSHPTLRFVRGVKAGSLQGSAQFAPNVGPPFLVPFPACLGPPTSRVTPD